MAINTARDRAEELLQNLQKRAREFLDAEEGLAKTVRDLVEENGLSPTEVRKRLDDLVGRLKSNEVWEKIRKNDKVVALGDYRDELEKKVEDTVEKLLDSLPVASKGDINDVAKQVKSLNRKVNDLAKKIKPDDE